MRKLIVVALGFVVTLVTSLSAENIYTVPYGYNLLDSRYGFKTYIKRNGNVLVVIAKTLQSKIRFSVGDEGGDYKGHRTFRVMYLKNHYNYNDYGHLYMALNGQFFAWRKYSPLSFGVKKDYDILQNKILESEKGKKALLIVKGKYPIFYIGSGSKYSKQKQIQSLINNDKISDAIVGVDPFDLNVRNAYRANSYIGRNMIGCIPYKKYDKDTLGLCKYTLFFIAKKSSFSYLINEMNKWGIKDKYILNLDSSYSAQAYSTDVQYKGNNLWFSEKHRQIPNAILLYQN